MSKDLNIANDQVYQNYKHYLALYSNCIDPVISAAVDRYSQTIDIADTIDLEDFCVFERKKVEMFRDNLKQLNNRLI